MNFFKNLSINYKLFTAYAAISVSIFTISFYLLFSQVKSNLEKSIISELSNTNRIITSMIETTAKVSVKNHLKSIANENYGLVKHTYEHFLNREISEKEAKIRAIKILLEKKVGDTGYVYCINSKGVIKVHPEKELINKDVSGFNFIKEQKMKKKGYLEYDWKNPGEKNMRPKALYMVYFEPWDWIISVSSYKSEFSRLISVEDFRAQIQSLKFGKSGYSFIIDSKGNTLIHPGIKGNLANVGSKKARLAVQEILSKKKGTLNYIWKNDNDKTYREKIVAFDYIPEFDWIIASSSYREEIFHLLDNIRSIFIIILFISLVLIFFVTITVSASITRPLVTLISRFQKGVYGDLSSLKFDLKRKDEIGKLSQSYNRFMEELDRNRKDLLQEIQMRKEVENQLRLFEKVFENVSEGISITDEHGNIEAVNQAFTDITGYEDHEVLGKNPRILKSDKHDESFYREMWNSILEKGHWIGEIWNRRKNGEAFPELLSISAIQENNDDIKRYVAVFRDISDMKTKEEEIERLAYHDPLTQLPNRTLLKDRLKQAVTEAKRSGEMIQILFLDLDDFKNVNDTIGHHWGDILLKLVGERMLSVVRSSDTVSRFGGDEFVIIIPHIKNTSEMAYTVERIQSVFNEPFSLSNQIFNVSCSIGVSVYPDDGEEVEVLIKHADLAMYQSKNEGKNRYSMFESQMALKIKQRVELEADIRDGIAKDQFHVYFQPRVDINSCEPKGMEALVRWIKEDGSIITPDAFIPLAEESGLIIPLGESIFRKSIEAAEVVREKTGLDLLVSVNVSIRQFEDAGFEDMVAEVLKERCFPSDKLEIEITESLLISDAEGAMTRLKNLSKMGLRTAIDDFGTGYSSLSYIKKLPISVLKIDKTFIDDIDDNPENEVITKTIILMGKNLNLDIVAEGVEDREQLEALRKFGDMEIQGYLFAKPMPYEELLIWIKNEDYKDIC